MNLRSLRPSLLVLAFAVVLTAASPAFAEPYDLFARYSLREGVDNKDGKERQFDILLGPDTVLPRAGLDYALTSIFLRMRTDDISNSTRSNFKRLDFQLVCDECKEKDELVRVNPGFIDIKPGSKYADKDILFPVQINSESAAQHLSLLVRSKLSDSYLCAQEQEFRTATGTRKDPVLSELAKLVIANPADDARRKCADSVDANKTVPKDQKAAAKALCGLTDSQVFAVAFLSKNPVQLDEDPKRPLVYTFCKEVAKEIDWTLVVKRNGSDTDDDKYAERIKNSRARQKEQLSRRLEAFLKERGFDNVRVGDDEGVEITARHSFTIVKELGAELSFFESTNSETRRLGRVVAQGSQLELRATDPRKFCHTATRDCATIISDALQVSLEGKDTKGNDVKKVLKLTAKSGPEWLIDIALADHLYKSVALRLHFKTGKKLIELRAETFTVEDIGLVTSVPIISELVTVFKSPDGAANWKDSSIKSSIPISWAFNTTCKEGRHVAITFPWMIGYNPRWAPRLSDTFKVFPHASVVFPTDDEAGTKPGRDACGTKVAGAGEPQLALGAGVSLVNTFTLSWGLSTIGQSYLLLGLSIPDLINLVK